jgi:hypothetical protein
VNIAIIKLLLNIWYKKVDNIFNKEWPAGVIQSIIYFTINRKENKINKIRQIKQSKISIDKKTKLTFL